MRSTTKTSARKPNTNRFAPSQTACAGGKFFKTWGNTCLKMLKTDFKNELTLLEFSAYGTKTLFCLNASDFNTLLTIMANHTADYKKDISPNRVLNFLKKRNLLDALGTSHTIIYLALIL